MNTADKVKARQAAIVEGDEVVCVGRKLTGKVVAAEEGVELLLIDGTVFVKRSEVSKINGVEVWS